MTITREQVERIAGWLEERPVVRMIGAGGIVLDDEQIASMLRDLWQRVEQSEARLDYVLSVMRSHGYWAALMTDAEVLAQIDAERGAK